MLPEPYWDFWPVNRGAFEHSVSVLSPRRRYNPWVYPMPADGSASRIEIGAETWHGTPLAVLRVLPGSVLPPDVAGEMLGDLAESWAALRMHVTLLQDRHLFLDP
jgi:hypothetical protein